MKELSFIVPLYSSAKWMRKCVDSLLEQDLPKEEYEIILVDDGSPDESGQIAEEYAGEHSNIRVIHQENKGASGARNTGLRAADSKYIWLVDPDDYIETNCLSKLLSKVEEENLDILRFAYRLVDEEYKEVKKHPSELSFNYSEAIISGDEYISNRLGIHCYIWTYIFKLSIIRDNLIYCYEGDYYDDTPWTPRVLQLAKRVGIVSDEVYFYVQRDNSLVRSQDKQVLIKKIRGEQFLIKELIRQRSSASSNIQVWYDKMLAHTILSYITTVSLLGDKEIKECCDFLQQHYRKKIKLKHTFGKMRKKAFLYNFSPKLLVLFIRIKH